MQIAQKKTNAKLTTSKYVDSIDIGKLACCLLSEKASLPKDSGVYIVISFEPNDHAMTVLPLYVGQSKNLKSRWSSHHKYSLLSQYPDVKIFYLCCDVPRLDEIESGLINKLRPVHNSKWTPVHPC